MNSTSYNTPPKRNKIVVFILAVICLILVFAYAIKLDFVQYHLNSFGLIDKRHNNNRSTIASWDSCLKQLHKSYEIAFIGDSLTAGHDFQSDFPDKSIINLGLSGDTILEIADRIFMLKTVSPKKVFLMAGVNSLQNENQIAKYFEQYIALCESIIGILPNVELYVISVLPVSNAYDGRFLGNIRGINNKFIRSFNSLIKQYADQGVATYIDLYPYYELNGGLNPAYSRDGLHITTEAYCYWVDAIRDYIITQPQD